MEFWERLDAAIAARGTTRKAVAAELGFAVSNFSSWKARRDYPHAARACAIAKHLGTTVEFLVEGAPPAGLPSGLLPIIVKLSALTPDNLQEVEDYIDMRLSKQRALAANA